MPFFSDHNVLFIHIPKNAGMYIEKCLGISWTFDQEPWLLKTEKQVSQLIYRAFRRMLFPGLIEVERLKRTYRYGDCAGMYKCQHATLSEVVSLRMLSKKVLESCTVLAVHRNPISRAISMYQWSAIHKYFTFDEFCERWILNPWDYNLTYGQLSHIRTQSSYIAGNERFKDKFNLISFENLEYEFDCFCKKYSINYMINNKINQSKPYLREVSDKSISIIAEVYEDDFRNFGYEMP